MESLADYNAEAAKFLRSAQDKEKHTLEVENLQLQNKNLLSSMMKQGSQKSAEQIEKERLELENLRLSNTQLKSSIFQVKYWWGILILNAIISLFIAWLTK